VISVSSPCIQPEQEQQQLASRVDSLSLLMALDKDAIFPVEICPPATVAGLNIAMHCRGGPAVGGGGAITDQVRARKLSNAVIGQPAGHCRNRLHMSSPRTTAVQLVYCCSPLLVL
jgi:hypothetical protein